MNKKFILKTLLLISLTCSFSCKKDTALSPIKTSAKNSKDGPIPTYYFDWANATYMPSSPSNSIPMPWNSGTTAIDPAIVSDYQPSDGWQLVYNTFTPNTPTSGYAYAYFFALYNEYKGVLRFYLWQPPTTIYSSYVNHGLGLYTTGATSNMLNYEARELVDDRNSNQSIFSKITNQTINSNGGTWFTFDYEIAYDPNLASSSFPNMGLAWNSKFVTVSQLTLNGQQIGSIHNNTISTSGTTFPLDGTLKTIANGVIEASSPSKLREANSNNTASAVEKLLLGIFDTATGGFIKGFLNAILGGNSASNAVNLKMQTNISLSGQTVQSGGLADLKLALPGQSNSQTANGFTPYYNNTMGVFSLTGPVVVKYTATGNTSPSTQTETTYNLTSDETNFNNIVFNPTVLSKASIQNKKEEIVILEPTKTYPLTYNSQAGSDYGFLGATGQKEIIGNRETSYTGQSIIVDTQGVEYNDDTAGYTYYPGPIILGGVCVRISFDVVPNNGAPKTTIVKTFVANVSSN